MDAPTVVQAVARELHGQTRGSLTRLSRLTGISLDSLRVAKRPPGTVGARPLSLPRARLLALMVAAYRSGQLDILLRDAGEIETAWRTAFPEGIADG
jgi:hypothetical protein